MEIGRIAPFPFTFSTTESESISIQFEYIDEINCLYVVAKGKVSLQEFLEFHRSILITAPPPTLLIFSDYRELDPAGLTTSDLEKIKADALSRTEYKYGMVKQAFVASDTLTFGLNNSIVSIKTRKAIITFVFESIPLFKITFP